MKVCYFGIYRSDNSRNTVYIKGLLQNGVEVLECSDNGTGIRKYLNLIKKHRGMKGKYDVMIVGYPGYTSVWLAWILTSKPIVFDALCTMYEAQVLSRNIYPLFSFNRIKTFFLDRISVWLSDVVLVETEAQKKYFEGKFRTKTGKVKVLYTGADDALFFPAPTKKKEKFSVVFRGRFLAEAGLKYIIEAAKLLEDKDIDFYIYGSGHVEKEVSDALEKHRPKNLMIERRFLSFDEIREKMLECHISLGQFADHERLLRTIPHKAFESLALGVPYVTGRAKGHEGFLEDGKTAFFANLGDARDLAEKILFLKENPHLLHEMAENGRKLYESTSTPKVLGSRLQDICSALIHD